MTTLGWKLKQVPFAVRNGLLFLRKWLSGWSFGVLTGIIVNVSTADKALSGKGITGFWQLVIEMFDKRSFVSFLLVTTVAILVFSYPGLYLISKYCLRRQWPHYLHKLSQQRTSRSIAPFSTAVISWDENLTLQLCHDIQKGWPIGTTEIQVLTGRFRMEPLDAAEYEIFLRTNASKDFVKNNNMVYGLADNPTSFTDSPRLTLRIKHCQYAETRFVNKVIAPRPERKSAAIDAIATDLTSSLPNKFVAHIVVITTNERLLATLASKKKEYAEVHDTWSYSIEEGLIEEDLGGKPTSRALRWVRRALHEELGVVENDYVEDDIKLLAVFLEGHNLNSGIVVVVHLGLNEEALKQRISSVPRPDTESLKVKFVSVDQAIRTLVSPEERLHPTSAYRLFLALCHLRTTPEVGRRIQTLAGG